MTAKRKTKDLEIPLTDEVVGLFEIAQEKRRVAASATTDLYIAANQAEDMAWQKLRKGEPRVGEDSTWSVDLSRCVAKRV